MRADSVLDRPEIFLMKWPSSSARSPDTGCTCTMGCSASNTAETNTFWWWRSRSSSTTVREAP